MAPITAADQAFLQLLTQRKVLEESEALEAMDAVGSKLGSQMDDNAKAAKVSPYTKRLERERAMTEG